MNWTRPCSPCAAAGPRPDARRRGSLRAGARRSRRRLAADGIEPRPFSVGGRCADRVGPVLTALAMTTRPRHRRGRADRATARRRAAGSVGRCVCSAWSTGARGDWSCCAGPSRRAELAGAAVARAGAGRPRHCAASQGQDRPARESCAREWTGPPVRATPWRTGGPRTPGCGRAPASPGRHGRRRADRQRASGRRTGRRGAATRRSRRRCSSPCAPSSCTSPTPTTSCRSGRATSFPPRWIPDRSAKDFGQYFGRTPEIAASVPGRHSRTCPGSGAVHGENCDELRELHRASGGVGGGVGGRNRHIGRAGCGVGGAGRCGCGCRVV